jgi:parallel beta-helix repeat protein
VSGNTAYRGGGGIHGRRLTLTNSTVSGNSLEYYGYGGGINARAGGGRLQADVNLTNSTVSGNTAHLAAGGGISVYNGHSTLNDSTVSGNTAFYSGGGIFVFGGDLTLTNSTVSGNTVEGYMYGQGGGISSDLGDLTLTNSTVTDNYANTYGGGIFFSRHGSTLADIANSIVADNHAPADANCESPLTSLGYNLTNDTSCGFTEPTDLIVADAMLGPLQDNGGPTETHALLPGSPAIDAGSLDCPPPATDQRGVARPQGAACDIGAVEYLPEPRGALALIAGAGFLGLLYRRRARGLRLG